MYVVYSSWSILPTLYSSQTPIANMEIDHSWQCKRQLVVIVIWKYYPLDVRHGPLLQNFHGPQEAMI